ncbi:hypothetical protein BOC46_07060 [Burkholderia pseudomallei]|nr:hypothetical protein BOC46_07060 [Burkholderia pseudomallei]
MTRLTDRHKTIPYFKRVLVSSDTWGRSSELDDLAIATRELRRLDWVFDAVIPTTDVTPEALGTEEVGGINPVDGVIDYLSQRTTRTE